MSKHLKNIGVVSSLTAVSRVTGMVRDACSAAIFGATVFNDAFSTAFALPNLFRRLLGEGALTAAFIPTLQEELKEGGEAGAYQLLNRVFSWLLLITGGLAGLAMLVLSQSRLVPGRADKWYFAADLTVIMFPYLALVCLAAALNATLNVMHRFLEPALSPIWLNLAMIASLVGAWAHIDTSPLTAVHWLCAGVLIGGFFQLTVPMAVLMRAGWKPRFDPSLSPQVRQIARLMLPGLFGTAIYQINTFVSRMLAFSLPIGMATQLYLSNRLMELPIGVFAIAVSTVVYPLIARHAVQRDFAAMAKDFHKGLRLILVINVPAAAGLALLSEPIIRLIYQRGHFTAENTLSMAPLLQLFVIGLPFFSVVNLTVRAFYAVKDTATPVKVAVVDFIANVILSLVLRQWLGASGLVLASTTAIVLQTLLLQRALVRKLPGLSFAPLWPSLGKVLVATLAMSAFVAGGWHWLAARGLGRVGDGIAIAGLIPAGVLLYGVSLWLLKIEGREDFVELLTKLRGRFPPRNPPEVQT